MAVPKHLVIPDTFQCRFVTSVNGRLTNVIEHGLIPAGQQVNVTLANAIATAMFTLWNADLASHAPPTTTVTKAILRDLRQPSMAEVESTISSPVGTGTTDELPLQIAAVLTLRTAQAGKKFRGRSYWCGFDEGSNGPNGHMTTAMKASLDTFAAGYMGAFNQSGCTLGVAHRPTLFDENTGLPVAPGLGFTTAVTQVVCRDDRWDSQRRRNR
jgi:hypothetical protein